MSRATVLYDNPGPKGQQRNRIIALVTILVGLALLVWVGLTLAANDQFEARLWRPFLDADTWTGYLLPGLRGTLGAAGLSIIFAFLLGTVLGVGRLSESRIIRWVCGVIVEFFRAVPVLLMMIFAYQLFALYAIFPSGQVAFAAVITGLTLYNGSVIAEILRSGIQSLPRGQSEAAVSLGLSRFQTIRLILLPQAITAMLPALISQMVIALKDSALGYQIGYLEVVRSGLQSGAYYRNFFASLVVVAIIMILINYALSALATNIERSLREGRKKKIPVYRHGPGAPGLQTEELATTKPLDPSHRDLRRDFGD